MWCQRVRDALPRRVGGGRSTAGAFLPQFVDVSRGAVAAQIVFLGLLFVALALVSDGLYAIGAGTARGWLRASPRVLAGERYVAGSVYIGLGLAAALSGGNRK